MVLDTRTLSSLYSLADVVREYTSPDETPDRRSRIPLTPQQKQDGCMLRYLHGWHVRHIVEALAIADANYSFNWEDNMMDALEECALSSYWNTRGLRLQAGAAISKEGPNSYGAARGTALRNAIAQILIADPTTRTAATKNEEGMDILGTSLMEKAFRVIDRQIEDGAYLNARPLPPGRQNMNRYIRDLEKAGFVWEGAGRTQIIAALPPDIKEAIDNEIRRQCRQHVAEGATIQRRTTRGIRERAAPFNYSAIARDVYSNFIINEQLQETMATLEYPKILPGYVLTLCQEANITVTIRRPFADQAADEANIKLVKDMREANPTYTAWRIHQRIGLQYPVVNLILDNLGLPHAGRQYTTTQIRRIILAAHDTEKLTIQEMLEKHPELVDYYADVTVRGAADSISGVLRRAGKIPHTEESLAAERTEERRIPLVASKVKGMLLESLRDLARDEAWLGRVSGNLRRGIATGLLSSVLFEETGFNIDSLAAALQETPEFIRKVIALLEVETPQLITMLESGAIVYPYSALNWITRGGQAVEGEEGYEGPM